MGLRLSKAEQDSGAWQKVNAYWSEELKTLRAKLEALGTPEDQRHDIVVRIHQIKKFLAVDDVPAKETGAG